MQGMLFTVIWKVRALTLRYSIIKLLICKLNTPLGPRGQVEEHAGGKDEEFLGFLSTVVNKRME